MLTALLRRKQEDTMPPARELQPGEIHFGIKGLDMNLTISHFDDQDAIVSEVIRGLGEHTPHQIQSVFTAGQAKSRLVMKLSRHEIGRGSCRERVCQYV